MKKIIVSIILVFGVVLIFQFMGCGPKKEVMTTPIDKTALEKPKDYVGSKRCAECHDKIYYNWKSTKHPYKISEPNEKTVVGDFWY